MNVLATISEGRARQSGKGRAVGADAPTAVSLTVPVPPSVNAMFRNVRGKGRVKTKAYDDWRAAALTHIRLQKVVPVAGRVFAVFGVERHSIVADIDNRIKAMLDAIVKAGIISDDKMVTGFAAVWLPNANGLAHIDLYGARDLTFRFMPSKDRATGGIFVLGASTPYGEPQWP